MFLSFFIYFFSVHGTGLAGLDNRDILKEDDKFSLKWQSFLVYKILIKKKTLKNSLIRNYLQRINAHVHVM